MQAVNETKLQFDNRTSLIRDATPIHLQPLAEIITEYAVTRYQLFQEAMLYKYHHFNTFVDYDRYMRLQHEIKLLAASNPVAEQFTNDLKAVKSMSHKLCVALGLSFLGNACNRITCYYDTSCSCMRPLFSGRISFPIDYF